MATDGTVLRASGMDALPDFRTPEPRPEAGVDLPVAHSGQLSRVSSPKLPRAGRRPGIIDP